MKISFDGDFIPKNKGGFYYVENQSYTKRDQERMRVYYQSAVLRVAKLAESG